MTKKYLKKIDTSIESNDSFKDCKFDRKKYAQNLTKIIEMYPSGFVMALNNEWGSGKTTFLKMWKNYLEANDFTAIYFSAWENDFETSPLIAIIAEIQEKLKLSNKKIPNEILKYGSKIVRHVLPEIIKILLKGQLHVNVEKLTEKLAESSTEILDTEINNYIDRKQNIATFKEKLSDFIGSNISNNSKPFVFIIDELDRCKPTYSVELLEIVKHLFSIDNIVFILSMDKTQLSSSIKGYFGNHDFNSIDYLRRFIDFEFSLPQPNIDVYVEHLCDYYELNSFFNTSDYKTFQSTKIDFDNFKKITTIYLKRHSLRQIEKYFILSRIVLFSLPNNNILLPSVSFFLIYLKTFQIKTYNRIEDNSISIDELSDVFYNLVQNDIDTENEHYLLLTEAQLVVFYSNLLDKARRFELLVTDSNGNSVPNYQSQLSTKTKNNKLESSLTLVMRHHDYYKINLSYYLNYINLINEIKNDDY